MRNLGLGDLGFLGAVGGGDRDPLFANVSLLLHGDGANGSTNIVDSSPTPKTVTAVGDARISTAQSKFGGSSIAFDGNGDYCSTAYSSDWSLGAANWTIEAWAKTSDSSSNYPSIVGRWQSVQNACWDFRPRSIDIGNFFCFVYSTNGSTPVVVNSNTVISDNNWHHLAATRSAGSLFLFVDGVLKVTHSMGSSIIFDTINAPLYIGYDPYGATYYNGYIDELRITKGIARYTANFAPPTAPFPDA